MRCLPLLSGSEKSGAVSPVAIECEVSMFNGHNGTNDAVDEKATRPFCGVCGAEIKTAGQSTSYML